jgi:hypothetical protein
MEKFFDYIDSSLPDNPQDKNMYKYKRALLDEMESRAFELEKRGLTDENVVADLVIGEHQDLKEDYNRYILDLNAKDKCRRFIISNIVGSIGYILAIVVLYLLFSKSTHLWSMTWAFLVDGILLWLVYLLSIGVRSFSKKKRAFHIIARICLFAAVMLLSVALLLLFIAVIKPPHSWLAVIGGVAAAFVADGLYAVFTKQSLAVINWLIYLPIIAAMVYIILCTCSVFSRTAGWVIIPAALVADMIIAAEAVRRNAKIKEEVIDSWNES